MPHDVYIIESVTARDKKAGRLEGPTLCGFLGLAQIPHRYAEVTDFRSFANAVVAAVNSGAEFIHISAHGDADGFCLTDGTEITWDFLSEALWPHLKGVTLAFSACSVGRGVEELFERRKSFCAFVVAPTRELGFHEAAAA
jgi:hypothetical protein